MKTIGPLTPEELATGNIDATHAIPRALTDPTSPYCGDLWTKGPPTVSSDGAILGAKTISAGTPLVSRSMSRREWKEKAIARHAKKPGASTT